LLYFINPIWLAGCLGIIVPVIIHLWNIRKGRVLRVGSTLLMVGSSQKSASSLRITQWLLLLLRCLVIIAVAMLLSEPQWRETPNRSAKGWVIIDKASFGKLYSGYKPVIDSLLGAGFELHAANPAFKKISIADALADTAKAATSTPYWQLLRRLDAQLPAGFPVYLYTTGQLDAIIPSVASERPTVSVDVHWFVSDGDTAVYTTPVSSRQLASGKIQQTYYKSAPAGSYYLHTAGDASSYGALHPDTSTLSVTIYNDKYVEDARYLSAAIRAIAGFGDYKLKLTSIATGDQVPAKQNWLFWLSDEKIPASLSADNIFSYEPGKPVGAKSWLTVENGPLNQDAIQIYQRVKEDDSNSNISTVIWKDGFGNPLLTLKSETNPKHDDSDNKDSHPDAGDQTNNYYFYTRFNPAWSELPWSADFPKLLIPLLLRKFDTASEKLNDRRTAEASDVTPTVVRSTYKTEKAAFDATPLAEIFWLITFLLFATERIISTVNSKGRKAKTSDSI
jgi:aerotolerance regulator-like protein